MILFYGWHNNIGINLIKTNTIVYEILYTNNE